MSDHPRHFPQPWTVEDNGAVFIVKDRAGTALASASKRRSASTLTKLACLVAVALQEVERGSLPQFEIGHSRFL